MPAGERERRHFDRIAAAKRQEAESRMQEASAAPAMKKIIEGLELGMAAPRDPATEALLERRTRAQAELHARARRLGMIR